MRRWEWSINAIRLVWTAGGIAAVLLTGGLWWSLYAQPSLGAEREELRELATLAELRQNERQTRLRAAEVSAEAERWLRAERAFRARVPVSADESGFLQWVSLRAQECGLSVRDFRPAGREPPGEFEGRSIMLAAQGSYAAIGRFLDRLRDCPRMNRVSSLEISPRDAERTTYNFTLQVVLFNQPPAATTPERG